MRRVPVLTVCLQCLGDIEALMHPHDAHPVVEVKGITRKKMQGQAVGPVTWLPGDPV